MRNRSMCVLALGLFVLTVGCQSPIAGTWKIAAGQPVGKVSIAAMTLAEDGTFTANAAYQSAAKVALTHPLDMIEYGPSIVSRHGGCRHVDGSPRE